MENYLRIFSPRAFIKNSFMCSTFYNGNVLCEQIWVPSFGFYGVCFSSTIVIRFKSITLTIITYIYTTSTSTEQQHNGMNAYCCIVEDSATNQNQSCHLYTLTKHIYSTHIRTTQIHLLYLALYIVHAKLTFILWLRSTNDFYIT